MTSLPDNQGNRQKVEKLVERQKLGETLVVTHQKCVGRGEGENRCDVKKHHRRNLKRRKKAPGDIHKRPTSRGQVGCDLRNVQKNDLRKGKTEGSAAGGRPTRRSDKINRKPRPGADDSKGKRMLVGNTYSCVACTRGKNEKDA